MAQRPKFNVQNTSFGRKCPLVAMLQSLKPYICTKYATHLAEKERLDREINQYLNKESFRDSPILVKQSLRILKTHPTYTIAQNRVKRNRKDTLFSRADIEQTTNTESPMNSEIISFNQKSSSNMSSENSLKMTVPIKYFMLSELKKFKLQNLINPIQEHFVKVENKIIWSKFVILQSEFEFMQQLEAVRQEQANSIDLISFQLDPNEINQIDQLKPQLQPEQELCLLEDNCSDNSNGFKTLLNTPITLISVATANWRRKTNKFIHILLTYFVVFCLISICFVFVP